MEEDDDNFLDGVIEFGDGRQYKIESADLPSESSLLSDPASSPAGPNTAKSRLDGIKAVKDPVPNIPVSKEERFADDFDRSWPRSHTSPASSRDFPLPNGPPSNQALPSPVSPIIQQGFNSTQEASRVLFNERSNRLERYSSTQRPGPGQHRGGPQDLTTSPIESRSARDIPGASPSHNNIQLLQKPGNEPPSRFRRFSGGGGSSGGFGPGPSNTLSRRDAPPPSPRLPRDDYSQPGRDRDFNTERGRRSDMGPPPLPAHTTRGQSRDGGRQVPPHLSQISPIVPAQRLPSRDSRRQPYTQSGEPNVPNSARLPSQSPALSHTSAARISPAVAITPLPPLSAPELDEVQKDLMQSAAARAKQRRQQEEEEREKEKERARRKAAELEERIRASAEKSKALEEPEVAKLTGNQVRYAFIASNLSSPMYFIGGGSNCFNRGGRQECSAVEGQFRCSKCIKREAKFTSTTLIKRITDTPCIRPSSLTGFAEAVHLNSRSCYSIFFCSHASGPSRVLEEQGSSFTPTDSTAPSPSQTYSRFRYSAPFSIRACRITGG